ncbi:MAG: hypothetical protein ACRCWR_03610 [Saezia sp.]
MEKKLFGKTVTVELCQDEDDITIEQLEKIYTAFESQFTEKMLADCISQSAQDLIDSLYEESNVEPHKDEFNKLTQDMALVRIAVYSDAFMLFFTAKKLFPGDEILVQLNEDYEVEDMVFEEE